MVKETIETGVGLADHYTTVRDRSSCVMRPDVETSAWLAAHDEFAVPVGLIATALVERFKGFGGNVCVSVQRDPDTGNESVRFEIKTKMAGRDARKLIDEFVDDELPECAAAVQDDLVFTVDPIGPASR